VLPNASFAVQFIVNKDKIIGKGSSSPHWCQLQEEKLDLLMGPGDLQYLGSNYFQALLSRRILEAQNSLLLRSCSDQQAQFSPAHI